MSSIDLNGRLLDENDPVFLASNKSYRYGDGLFETIKVRRGQIVLEDLHFTRLFESLHLLGFRLPVLVTREKLAEGIFKLCARNNASGLGRVRLSFFRGNGGLTETNDTAGYLIESWPLDDSIEEWNSNGLVLGVYRDARKCCDRFSGVKTSSFLPYVQAARFAKANQLNDALVLNNFHRICDSTIANVFLVKNGHIFTPPLTEGCINGVMRRFLLSHATDTGLIVEEKGLTVEDVMQAEEIFLTNVIRGVRWVGQVADRQYDHATSLQLHNSIKVLLYK